MMLDLLDIIDDELISDGFNTNLSEGQIIWKDGFGAENEVLKANIAYSGKDIAWWQTSEVGKDLLRIKKANGLIINWRPESNHSDFRCNWLKWFGEQLIVMYTDKHNQFVFRFEGLEFKKIFVGKIAHQVIKDEVLYIREPEWHNAQVLRLNLLSDNEASVISEEELNHQNIIF
jgi:hypothetical protein